MTMLLLFLAFLSFIFSTILIWNAVDERDNILLEGYINFYQDPWVQPHR